MVNQTVAVKVNENRKEMPQNKKQTLPHFTLREIDALRELSGHPNIVQLLDLFRNKKDSSKIYMILEYLEGGDLRKFYKERYREGMPVDMVLGFTEQLLKATEFLHSKGYIHRDIKSSNLVIGQPGSYVYPDGRKSNIDRVLKLADFGLSRVMPLPPNKMTKEIATLNWRAPEVILDNLSYN